MTCTPELHDHLRRHPEAALNLRWWSALEMWIAECADCRTTLAVDEPECPPEQERVDPWRETIEKDNEMEGRA